MNRFIRFTGILLVLGFFILFPSCGETVKIPDVTGKTVEINQPVERIVCMNSGLSALIAAFEEADRIVGRDSFSTFPTSLIPVFVVGKSSAHPNLELILQLKPDLVVADKMLHIPEREKLESLGIPVVIESTSDPDRLMTLIQNFGLILSKREKAGEISAYIQSKLDIVHERISKLKIEKTDFPAIFFENRRAYKSASTLASSHKPLAAAGGRNIAAAEPVVCPRLSSEFIVQQDPAIIIRRMSGDANEKQMKEMQDDIMSRAGLSKTRAVQNGSVYIIKADILLALRYPIGLLYYAKWFHPEAFKDIDPKDEHRKLITRFFGAEEWEKTKEVFTYPN